MEDSLERHKNIKAQLSKIIPTSKIIVVYNKGYKKCKKMGNCGEISISYEDLTHAVMHIFSISEDYNRILILEDDFIFRDHILKGEVSDINTFLLQKKPMIYSLGCINLIQNPFFGKHIRLHAFATMHAVIYSKECRKKLQLSNQDCKKLQDIDSLTCFNLSNVYTYHRLLSVQTFPETENKKNWSTYSPLICSIGNVLLTAIISGLIDLLFILSNSFLISD